MQWASPNILTKVRAQLTAKLSFQLSSNSNFFHASLPRLFVAGMNDCDCVPCKRSAFPRPLRQCALLVATACKVMFFFSLMFIFLQALDSGAGCSFLQRGKNPTRTDPAAWKKKKLIRSNAAMPHELKVCKMTKPWQAY